MNRKVLDMRAEYRVSKIILGSVDSCWRLYHLSKASAPAGNDSNQEITLHNSPGGLNPPTTSLTLEGIFLDAIAKYLVSTFHESHQLTSWDPKKFRIDIAEI